MRILVLTDSYPPHATGGYERSCADVVARWRRAGHDVLVVTAAGAAPAETGVLRVLTATDATALPGVLRTFGPDVVSAWNLARLAQRDALAPVAAAGTPVVFYACDAWLADADPAVPPAAPGSVVAFVSADLRDRVRLPSWAPRESTVVAAGIDAETFVPRARQAAPWRGRLLYVGRLAQEKGVADAVDALLALPGATLRIVGADRPERWAALRAQLADRGVAARVTTATTDRRGLVAEYSSADVVLFPSRWREPFGLVPLEAMACATPVVATGTGGSASYLMHEGNALLVPPGDPGALAGAVRRVAADARLRCALVAAGLETSAHYTVDRTAVALGELNERVATTSR